MEVSIACDQCGDQTGRCDCPRPWQGLVADMVKSVRNVLEQEGKPVFFIPDVKYIETLNIGDLTLDRFGRISEVTEIVFRNYAQVRFLTAYGYNGSRVSHELTANRLARTTPFLTTYGPVELNTLEYELLRALKADELTRSVT